MTPLISAADRIFVAGHRGMAGSAICRCLKQAGYSQVLTADRDELDLLDQLAVQRWFAENKPSVVVLAAAKVGGIHANNTYPADFLLENLKIEINVIETAWRSGVRRLLFLGSSCIYPKFAEQPIREESLLEGSLEPTNEWYALAKISGIKLCQALRKQHGFDAISLMPTNLYGPGDNYHPTNSHVLPALIRRFHEAAERGDSRSLAGEPAHLCGSFCTWMILARPVCLRLSSGSQIVKTCSSSMWVPALISASVSWLRLLQQLPALRARSFGTSVSRTAPRRNNSM